jgi:hypothetical protein
MLRVHLSGLRRDMLTVLSLKEYGWGDQLRKMTIDNSVSGGNVRDSNPKDKVIVYA